MMPKKKTQSLALSMLILTALSAGVFFSLLSLMGNKVLETVNNTNEIKTEIAKEESLSFMQKNVLENQTNKNLITGYILPANSVSDFIQTLEDVVATSGLKSQINSITSEPSDALLAANAELLDVKMSVIGPWSNMHFFLQLLESYPLKISMKNVSLKQFANYTVKGKQVPQWSGDIEFTVVKLKDN